MRRVINVFLSCARYKYIYMLCSIVLDILVRPRVRVLSVRGLGFLLL